MTNGGVRADNHWIWWENDTVVKGIDIGLKHGLEFQPVLD